jgi:hypothetical protein
MKDVVTYEPYDEILVEDSQPYMDCFIYQRSILSCSVSRSALAQSSATLTPTTSSLKIDDALACKFQQGDFLWRSFAALTQLQHLDSVLPPSLVRVPDSVTCMWHALGCLTQLKSLAIAGYAVGTVRPTGSLRNYDLCMCMQSAFLRPWHLTELDLGQVRVSDFDSPLIAALRCCTALKKLRLPPLARHRSNPKQIALLLQTLTGLRSLWLARDMPEDWGNGCSFRKQNDACIILDVLKESQQSDPTRCNELAQWCLQQQPEHVRVRHTQTVLGRFCGLVSTVTFSTVVIAVTA